MLGADCLCTLALGARLGAVPVPPAPMHSSLGCRDLGCIHPKSLHPRLECMGAGGTGTAPNLAPKARVQRQSAPNISVHLAHSNKCYVILITH